jgi:hypothetical protein
VDIVLGVSMAPTTLRLVLIEGQDADGVTVEEDEFEAGGPDQVIAAIVGAREGAAEGGCPADLDGGDVGCPWQMGTTERTLAITP